MTKRNLAALAAVLLAAGLAGCGGGDDGGGSTSLTNYNTGPVPSVPAVGPVNQRTLLPATADTHEVETDGNWIVWKARQINVGYYDGTNYSNLNLGLSGAVTPWAFNWEPYESPIAYDGSRIAFVANDVSDAAVAAFYYGAPGGAMRKLALPDTVTTQLLGDFDVILDGNVAAVIDESATPAALYVANLGAAAPAFAPMDYTGTLLYFDYDGKPVTGGGKLALSSGGAFALLDLATGVQTSLTGDGSSATDPAQARYANGAFTWTENNRVYFYAPGYSPTPEPDPAYADSKLIANAVGTVAQSMAVAGPWGTYVMWQEYDSNTGVTVVKQRPWNQLGLTPDGATIKVVQYNFPAASTPWNLWSYIRDLGGLQAVRTGTGFIAWLGPDANGDTQLFTLYVGQLATGVTERPMPVQVTSDVGSGGDRRDDRVFLIVEGSKVFFKQQFTARHSPGRVFKVFDYSTQTMKTILDGRDFQQLPLALVSGGKAVTLTRDHSFRLFARKAGAAGAPVVITPKSQDVKNFAVAGGIVAYAALDRSLYLDNDFLHEYVIDDGNADFLIEIYAHDLDAGGAPRRLTWNWSEDDAPQTDGQWVTWRDDDYSLAYAMSLAELAQIPIGRTGDKVPVAGGLAAWLDYGTGTVRYHDLVTGTWGQASTGGASYCPAVAGRVIAWAENFTAHYLDLGAAAPEDVTIPDARPSYMNWGWEYAAPVDTDGRFVTWVEYRAAWDHDGDAGTADIASNVVVVHDLRTDASTDVPAADFAVTGVGLYSGDDGNEGPVCNPKVSNGVVAFAAIEYGAANPDLDKEIFTYDAAAAPAAVTRVTNDEDGAGRWDSRLRVGGNLAVWRSGGSSYWDWDGKVPAVSKLK